MKREALNQEHITQFSKYTGTIIISYNEHFLFVQKRTMSAVKRVEFVSNLMM